MSEAEQTVDYVSYDAERVMTICGDVGRTKALLAWMDCLIEENVTMQTILVESADESRINRLAHLASQISAFRRIKDAANRALASASGKPPVDGLAETAQGGVI